MKRYFKTITAVVLAVLAVAACQKENLGEVAPDGREAEVKLTLTSPQIGTKSYADGLTVNRVFVHVYQRDADGNLKYIAPAGSGESATPSQVVDMIDGAAKYSTRLVTGQKYTFVFWAECLGAATSPYTYDPETKTVTVNYAGVAGNDETRDAFCNVLKDVEITGAYSSDVKLYRPFAQLNFGVTSEDYAAAKAAGLEVTAAKVKLTNAATSLNLLDGTVSGAEDVTFAAAALPTETLSAAGATYKYVAMDYVLVGKAAKTLSDVTLTLTATGTQSATPEFTYSNVPLQANYRTNIVGNLFTSPAEVNITVDPAFDTPDYDVVVGAANLAAANEAFAKGATAVTVEEIVSSDPDVIVLPKTSEGVAITLPQAPDGKSITIKYDDTAAAGQKPQTLKVTAKNAESITIVAPDTHVEVNGVTVGTLTATTSGSTLVVGKDVKITTLNIEQGAAEIYGNVSEVVKGDNAGTVTWYTGDVTAFTRAVRYADRIVLENDINRTFGTYSISGGRVLTIDLNGHKISSPSMVFRICGAKVDFIGQGEIFETADDGFAPILINGSKEDVNDYTVVNIGKDITLRGWTGVFIDQDSGLCYGVKVNCSAKIEKTESFEKDATGVYVNGTIKATEGNVPVVNLDGCRINVKSEGIYAAGFAKWNLKNCDIVAENAAVEIRAGEMVIDGGNYEATADPLTVTPNGNGSTVEGAAIGVSQHTTNLPTSVTIKKGTFRGAYSIWEKDVQDEVARDVITLSVENGTFNGSVYSQNNASFIKGGTFSDAPAQDYLAEGYASVTASANPLTYKVVKATKADTEGAIKSSLNIAGTATVVSQSVSVSTISVKKKSTLKLVNNAVVAGNGGPEGKHNDAIQLGSGANLSIEGEGSIKACTNPSSQTPAINVLSGGVVNVYDGVTVDGGSGSKGNYAIKLVSGTANIYGGYFCSGVNADGSSSEVIYLYSMRTWQSCAKTVLNIYGGVFEQKGGSSAYLINCYDKPYKAGYCSVKIMGGTFVGFNPADNTAEGDHTNFVAPGYKSVETKYNGKDAWEVVPE